MKRRLLVPVIAGTVLATAAGVASANAQYWRDNGLLLEVSADPRDGADVVQVDATRAARLELVALNDVVTLRGLTIRFADGRSMSRAMHPVRPGQPISIELPRHAGTITSVELDYGNPELRRHDRTAARLQIIPHHDGSDRFDRYDRDDRFARGRDRDRRFYATQRPQYQPYRSSGYVVRPAPQRDVVDAGWTIRGSFRF